MHTYTHTCSIFAYVLAFHAKLCQRSPTALSGALMRLKVDNLMLTSQPTLIAYAHFVLLLFVFSHLR